MANTAKIYASGNKILLQLDPASGTIGGEGSFDAALLESISITASDGDVNFLEVVSPKKYTFLDLAGNQFQLKILLDRQITHQATVTVDVPANLVSDGTRTNAAASIACTNNSLWHESHVGEILEDDAKIAYVDPVNGDDTLAAAANGGLGYYTKLSPEVGSNPESPVGTPVAWKTSSAAQGNLRGSTATWNYITLHGAILYRRGTTVDGATDFAYTSGILYFDDGESSARPFGYGSYGPGSSDAILQAQQTAASGTQRAVRITSRQGNLFFGRGLRIKDGVNGSGSSVHSVQIISSSNQAAENCLFVGVKIDRGVHLAWFNTPIGSTYDDICFVNCVFDGQNAGGSGGIFQCDGSWSVFPFRNLHIQHSLFQNAALSGSYHGLYLKTVGDLLLTDNYFYDIGGSCVKLDTIHGAHVKRNIMVDCNSIANIEANGLSEANLPTDRLIDDQTTEYPVAASSEGAFSKWVTVEDNIITDCLAFGERGSNQVGIVHTAGPSQRCEAKNNLGVFLSDNQVTVFGIPNYGGSFEGHYCTDTHRLDVLNNTAHILATMTNQATAVSLLPATSDLFTAANNGQLGMHTIDFSNNIFSFGTGPTGARRFTRFGGFAGLQDYAASFAAGRSQVDIDYNCFYSETGSYTDGFINGTNAAGDALDSVAAIELDMNSGSDTSMTGNRSENPSFPDYAYQISDYLTTDLLYATVAEAFGAIRSGILSESMPAGLSVVEIAQNVLPKHIPTALNASDYNGVMPGFDSWVQSVPEAATAATGRTSLPATGDMSITVSGTTAKTDYSNL